MNARIALGLACFFAGVGLAVASHGRVAVFVSGVFFGAAATLFANGRSR